MRDVRMERGLWVLTSVVRNLLLPLSIWGAGGQLALAQTPDLGSATLRDLLRIEVHRVFGASERLQPVTEAPAAVSIVTADEIRRYGYRTLADVLRGVRGFYVSNDRNYSYLGVRGFSQAGDYNTRVLLLLNGQRLNDSVYDQAQIGTEFGLDMAMVDRVEIIRGPASSLYGTNALFAVVNVVTRTGAALDGTIVEAGVGALGTRSIRTVTGRRLDNGVDYAAGFAIDSTEGVRHLYFPEMVAQGHADGIARDLDAERVTSFYGRLSLGALTIFGGTGFRHKDVPTASYGSVFNSQDPKEQTRDDRTDIGVQFDRALGRNRVTASGAFQRYWYTGRYPYPDAQDPAAHPVSYDDGSEGSRVTLNVRVTRPLFARQTFTAGAEFTENLRQDQWATSPEPSENWRLDRSSRAAAVFVQDEVAVRSWLRLSGGLRFDSYGPLRRTTPRGAVILSPTGSDVVKYLYGRAFRAPNAYELYYYSDASSSLLPETVDTHELVWERYTGNWLRTSVAGYWYEASQLIGLREVDPDAVLGRYGFFNEGRRTARGLEAEAEVRHDRGLQAFVSYTGQQAVDADGARLTNSPAHLGTFRGSVGESASNRFVALELLHASGRLTLRGHRLPAVTLLNATASAPLGRALSLVAVARNLLGRRYADPASDEHAMDSIEQNGRTWRAEIRWRIGPR